MSIFLIVPTDAWDFFWMVKDERVEILVSEVWIYLWPVEYSYNEIIQQKRGTLSNEKKLKGQEFIFYDQ